MTLPCAHQHPIIPHADALPARTLRQRPSRHLLSCVVPAGQHPPRKLAAPRQAPPLSSRPVSTLSSHIGTRSAAHTCRPLTTSTPPPPGLRGDARSTSTAPGRPSPMSSRTSTSGWTASDGRAHCAQPAMQARRWTSYSTSCTSRTVWPARPVMVSPTPTSFTRPPLSELPPSTLTSSPRRRVQLSQKEEAAQSPRRPCLTLPVAVRVRGGRETRGSRRRRTHADTAGGSQSRQGGGDQARRCTAAVRAELPVRRSC